MKRRSFLSSLLGLIGLGCVPAVKVAQAGRVQYLPRTTRLAHAVYVVQCEDGSSTIMQWGRDWWVDQSGKPIPEHVVREFMLNRQWEIRTEGT